MVNEIPSVTENVYVEVFYFNMILFYVVPSFTLSLSLIYDFSYLFRQIILLSAMLKHNRIDSRGDQTYI
jgi:hypothetical protein